MDSPTFEALKRIMELIRPRGATPMELREDWQRVAAWMHDAARDIDDLDTLGTDDSRRQFRRLQSLNRPSRVDKRMQSRRGSGSV